MARRPGGLRSRHTSPTVLAATAFLRIWRCSRGTSRQPSGFLATSRLRGQEAIEWVARASALNPDDKANGLLLAPSLALGSSFIGRRAEAHAALDRWLDDPGAPRPGAGFVLLALKGFLLLADGDVQ